MPDSIPYGYCQCGCGERTKLHPNNDFKRGYVKGEPRQFLAKHRTWLPSPISPPNPDGYCMCGCGQKAPVAAGTSSKQGTVKGKPVCYINGHKQNQRRHLEAKERIAERQDRRTGFCECGCGEKTSIATDTSPRRGDIKGEPYRYIRAHQGRRHTPQYLEIDTGYDSPCWIWQWFIDWYGYGAVRVESAVCRAHRVYYEASKGTIESGKQLHHLCEQRACVNPDHLLPVTPKEHGSYR